MRVTRLLWACIAGCRHPGTPPLPEVPDPQPPGPTASTTAETGSTPAPVEWPDWATDFDIPPLPAGFTTPPSVRIFGFKGLELGTYAVMFPADHGQPGMAFVTIAESRFPEFGLPSTLLLPVDVPDGDYRVLELWDGVSGYDGPLMDPTGGYGFAVAGDVDGDGYRDLWIYNALYLGPIGGQLYPWWSNDGAYAWIDEEGSSNVPVATPLGGEYDADGDGHLDVVMGSDVMSAMLYYGPLVGAIPAAWASWADPDEYTVFGDAACWTPPYPTLLPDALGPGHPAFAIGRCPYDPAVFVWDLLAPRGARVSDDQAVAEVQPWGFDSAVLDAGDVDGDGFGDVIAATCNSRSFLAGGPVAGELDQGEPPVPVTNGNLCFSLGDLNGDGVHEFFALTEAWDYVAVFSPYTEGIDLFDALVLGNTDVFPTSQNGAADLDGDGLADLWSSAVPGASPPPDLMGELRIWHGADLAAAELARTTPPQTRRHR